MNLFIDGEWNSYQGQLISLALVTSGSAEFYEVLECTDPDPWVADNVIPKLGKDPITLTELQSRLETFLSQFNEVHIVADWPEDVMWLCRVLVTGPGTRLDTPPLTFEVLRADTVSENPHNALADAKGLRDWYISNCILAPVISDGSS
jgi:hypothetical protein